MKFKWINNKQQAKCVCNSIVAYITENSVRFRFFDRLNFFSFFFFLLLRALEELSIFRAIFVSSVKQKFYNQAIAPEIQQMNRDHLEIV